MISVQKSGMYKQMVPLCKMNNSSAKKVYIMIIMYMSQFFCRGTICVVQLWKMNNCSAVCIAIWSAICIAVCIAVWGAVCIEVPYVLSYVLLYGVLYVLLYEVLYVLLYVLPYGVPYVLPYGVPYVLAYGVLYVVILISPLLLVGM